ncbi:hypothetical protein VTJ83DRAFT_1587 [Remersonia thermophila]|uniref:Uncharacterized protein n=1 Tax=Remersonia thermophila TaxID=72144 RepID=A0ABR4DGC0_9PEZI
MVTSHPPYQTIPPLTHGESNKENRKGERRKGEGKNRQRHASKKTRQKMERNNWVSLPARASPAPFSPDRTLPATAGKASPTPPTPRCCCCCCCHFGSSCCFASSTKPASHHAVPDESPCLWGSSRHWRSPHRTPLADTYYSTQYILYTPQVPASVSSRATWLGTVRTIPVLEVRDVRLAFAEQLRDVAPEPGAVRRGKKGSGPMLGRVSFLFFLLLLLLFPAGFLRRYRKKIGVAGRQDGGLSSCPAPVRRGDPAEVAARIFSL